MEFSFHSDFIFNPKKFFLLFDEEWGHFTLVSRMKETIRLRFDSCGYIANTYAGILNLVSTDLV